MPFVVLLDADALHPPTVRDTLLRAVEGDLFQPRWSRSILDEAERRHVEAGVPASHARTLRTAMERAFPEALVEGDAALMPALGPVAAAAVKGGAQLVVTTRRHADLPEDVDVQTPDEWLCNLFDLDREGFLRLLHRQAGDHKKPPCTVDELLARLARTAPDLVGMVRAHLAARNAAPATS